MIMAMMTNRATPQLGRTMNDMVKPMNLKQQDWNGKHNRRDQVHPV